MSERNFCERCGKRISALEWDIHTCTPPAQPQQEPVALHAMAKRRIFDAIRSAYDLGYNDARNARTTPGDSAPGYKGRDVEADHGGALICALERYTTPPAAPVQEPVAWMHEWEDGERIPLLHGRDDRNTDQPKTVRPLIYGDTTPPAQPAPVQPVALPFGVGGGLVAIKTLLSRDPCAHANTAIQMIDAMLAKAALHKEDA